MENFFIKLLWRFVCQFVRQLTSLRLNHISFTRSNAVGLRVYTFVNAVGDSFLVIPSTVLQADEALRWRLVLLLRPRLVEIVPDVVNSTPSYKPRSAID